MLRPMVIIKGAGDIASGVAHRLKASGFYVLMIEISRPTVIRRTVAFAEAVYQGQCTVEGETAVLAKALEEVKPIIRAHRIAVLVDEKWSSISRLKPLIVVDAIIAKRNLGTALHDAPVVIGLGPGFTAGQDVHAIIETNRGHDLGRVIYHGTAAPNTGIPGEIGGYTSERVLRSPVSGTFRAFKRIGDYVEKGDILGVVANQQVVAPISGVLRGILNNNVEVAENLKIGDIDPRGKHEHCNTISEKARAIGGGVLEAALTLLNKGGYLWK